MQVIRSINFMDEKKYAIALNLASLGLILPFLALFGSLARALYGANEGSMTSLDFLLQFVFLCALLVLHELIHGFFFKILGKPGTRVKFGFKKGMAYATSPGSFYRPKAFLIIALAPFVLLSLALTLLAALGWLNPLSYVLLASLHAAGCVGDFYLSYVVLRQKSDDWIEDTESGINIYKESKSGL